MHVAGGRQRWVPLDLRGGDSINGDLGKRVEGRDMFNRPPRWKSSWERPTLRGRGRGGGFSRGRGGRRRPPRSLYFSQYLPFLGV